MSIDEESSYFGTTKPKIGVKLPDKEFTYGRPNRVIDGGAQEAMQYLVLQEKRQIQKAQERSKKIIKESTDYIKLDRIAVKSGLVRAVEQRNAMDTLIKKSVKTRNSSKNKITDLNKLNICEMPPAGLQKTRNCRVDNDENAALLAFKKQRAAEEKEKHRKKKIYETQAKLIRRINDKALLREEERSNPKTVWQMSKFKNVKSTLDTFRSEELKEKSFRQHEDNRCIRLGQTGHGNYKQIC